MLLSKPFKLSLLKNEAFNRFEWVDMLRFLTHDNT